METKMSGLRKWATPLTIGSFAIMGVTGVLMFFHLESGLNKPLHEWAGWIMVIAVFAHVILNYRAFLVYLKRPVARAIALSSVALLCLSFIPSNTNGGSPVPIVLGALKQAPIEQVIAVAGLENAAGITKLHEAGYAIAPGTTIAAATGGDRGAEMAVLKALFVR